MKNFYVILIEVSNGLFLLTRDRKMDIHAFKTEKEALEHFEDGYNDCHKRGYESSMSACINNITFRPSVIEIPTPNEIEYLQNNVVGKEPHGFTIRNVSGMMYGLSTIPEAKKLWENGVKPKLISEKTFHEKI